MTFAHPSYLWALTALAIPLAIHLLSRKEGKVIKVGTLRHVEESNTSQFKSIRLNEVLLLLLRFLMVVSLALFLSGAQCSNPGSSSQKILYLERGISTSQVDTLISAGYELRELPLDKKYWTIVEELNQLPHDIVVVSYSRAENFEGQRIPLSDNIRWITAETPQKEYPALAWTVGDSVFVRTGTSNAMMTVYTTGVGVPDSIEVIRPTPVNISTDDRFVIAALGVLKKEYGLPIRVTNNEQPIMKVEVTPGLGPIVERISPTEIHVNKKLDQDIALNENLVIELFKVLYPELQKPEVNKDMRVLPDELAWSKKNDPVAAGIVNPPAGIEKYLIMLFVLSLAAERFVAICRNQ